MQEARQSVIYRPFLNYFPRVKCSLYVGILQRLLSSLILSLLIYRARDV